MTNEELKDLNKVQTEAAIKMAEVKSALEALAEIEENLGQKYDIVAFKMHAHLSRNAVRYVERRYSELDLY